MTVVEGGYLKEPHVVRTCLLTGPDECDVECVVIGKTEKWLAEAVTGKHVSFRCLGRSVVFDEIRSKCLEKPLLPVLRTHGRGDDMMDGLDYEDDLPAVSTPIRRKASKRKAGDLVQCDIDKTPTKRADGTLQVIKMRATASAVAETVDVTAVMRRKQLLLRLQDLPWLLEYLHSEIEQVPAVGEDSEDDKGSVSTTTIFWDFHNGCYTARKKSASGEPLIKRGYVEKRMRTVGDVLHGLDRDEAKKS